MAYDGPVTEAGGHQVELVGVVNHLPPATKGLADARMAVERGELQYDS